MVLEASFEFFDSEGWMPFAPNELNCSLRSTWHAFRNSGNY